MPKDSRKLSLAQTLGFLTVASLILGQTSSLAQSPSGQGKPYFRNETEADRRINAAKKADATTSSKHSSENSSDTSSENSTKIGPSTSAQAVPAHQAAPAQVTADSHTLTGAAEKVEATAPGEDQQKSAATIANNNALDHYELAQYYIGKFDFKMAELELEVALMHVPTMKTAHRDYCLVSILRGHPLRATAEFMMVVGLGEPIPLNDAERQELTARGAKLHYQRGLEFGGKRQWDSAIAEFKWAQQYAPQNAAIVRSLAFSYASHGDFELAETTYARGFAMDPSDPYGHADFAYILSEHGQSARAVDQLSSAIKLDPKVAALHVDMGWMAESTGDLARAETEFHEAVQLSPKHAGLWSHLGRVEERLGKAVAAKNAYAEALAIDPSQDEARKYLDELKGGSSSKDQPNSGKQAKKSS
jgi:Tfp pilus assembly protein PilF